MNRESNTKIQKCKHKSRVLLKFNEDFVDVLQLHAVRRTLHLLIARIKIILNKYYALLEII